ncbi:MHS family MFS transporter [Pseudonocardia sp. MCCB 268]|nr:MHS family MFS transporter [Pseudonocardia cytotoxica]
MFGHYGDLLGRRATLTASLFLMGGSTFLIAFLPSYDSIGVPASLALVALRLIQASRWRRVGRRCRWSPSTGTRAAAQPGHPMNAGIRRKLRSMGVLVPLPVC